MEALGEAGATEALPVLLNAMRNEERSVREEAAEALVPHNI
jgi:HEAT repeat protein